MVSRYAIIEEDRVANVAVADAAFAAEQGWIEAPPHVAPGWLYEGGEFKPAPPDLQALASQVRAERDRRLREEVDPIVTNPLRWADLTVEQQEAWAAYRRALLDVPEQDGFPTSVVWPEAPQ